MRCGMALLLGAAPGTDIVLTEERMESARAFANKIWNASRLIFMNMERSRRGAVATGRAETLPARRRRRQLESRWRTAGFSAV